MQEKINDLWASYPKLLMNITSEKVNDRKLLLIKPNVADDSDLNKKERSASYKESSTVC